MKTFRCGLGDIGYALEAIRVVKNAGDGNPPELATPELMERFLSNPANYLLVTVIDGRVAGFAVAYELQQVYRDARELFFFEIEVLKEFRRRGAGTALIGLLKQICAEEGYVEMYVPTHRTNIPAAALYRKAGGRESGSDDVSFTWKFE